MIYKNDLFLLNGARHRLLHCRPEVGDAWAINIDDGRAWPQKYSWSSIAALKPYSLKAPKTSLTTDEDGVIENPTEIQTSQLPREGALKTTEAMIKARDMAMAWLGNLASDTVLPGLFDEALRGQLILERAQEAGCSVPTLYKHLRRYWMGGQTPAALLGNFHRCGRFENGTTARRGAKPEFDRPIYQLSEDDFRKFDDIIKNHYCHGDLLSMTEAHQRLLEIYYEHLDGNGDSFLLSEGERPTFRQFQHYLKKTYTLEYQLRQRKGDKDFDRDHRAVLGTVLADCLGVGHYYEADATIADVYLAASDDIKKIIGKPTIYLIVDRKSRLIVGWYVGLENPSWICAMQAFLCISQDKQALCERLGIQYRESDWPAHEVFPKHVLADRSELVTRASELLTSELGITVSIVPSKRPDWKPIVECGFKQTRMIIQDGSPGFDPPENAKKRQAKRYDKDACMTLTQFETVVVQAILAHNRKPLLGYQLSLSEIGNEVDPIPVSLWNHDIVNRAGLLPRFDEERVRMALLERDEASVSEEGIVYKGCYYSCQEAISKSWFVTARRKAFTVRVAFDRRLVDKLFVFDPDNSGRSYECNLTTRGVRYKGLSFCEVQAIEKITRSKVSRLAQIEKQVKADFHRGVNPVYSQARLTLKDAKLKASRAARRADTKEARAEELSEERQKLAALGTTSSSEKAQDIPISDAQKPPEAGGATAPNHAPGTDKAAGPADGAQETDTGDRTSDVPMTPQEKLNQIKERMLRG